MIDLKQGDCLELMKDIPDNSIDMILCDLPYGTTSNKWDKVIPFEPLWEQYNRIIKPNGAICLFGSEPFSTALRTSNLRMYRYDWIWEKTVASNFVMCKKQPFKKHEIISVFYCKQPTYNPQFEIGKPYNDVRKGNYRKNISVGDGNKLIKTPIHNSGMRYPSSVIKFSNGNNGNVHPTQKPVPLLEYLIKTYTNEGEIVLDNCMGSGSTGVACVNTNRNFIGFELDEHYFEIAKKRIEEAQTALSNQGGISIPESRKELHNMRELNTIQKREKLNRVYAIDEKGNGGANHRYEIDCPLGETNDFSQSDVTIIQFQNGARKFSDNVHGVLDTDLLEIVRDRLKGFQSGEFATRENAIALTHIEDALMWLNRRVEDRIERNVLGTNNE